MVLEHEIWPKFHGVGLFAETKIFFLGGEGWGKKREVKETGKKNTSVNPVAVTMWPQRI